MRLHHQHCGMVAKYVKKIGVRGLGALLLMGAACGEAQACTITFTNPSSLGIIVITRGTYAMPGHKADDYTTGESIANNQTWSWVSPDAPGLYQVTFLKYQWQTVPPTPMYFGAGQVLGICVNY